MVNRTLDPRLMSLLEHGAVAKGVTAAVQKSSGARFYKVALQINPYQYATRHAKNLAFKGEDEYNAAIVAACLKNGVEVVGLTDHFRVATSKSLADALTAAGIEVFIGFEASSSEGVHVLCFFPRDTSLEELERHLGALGVTDLEAESPQSNKTCDQLVELVAGWNGVAICAHACSASGVLTTLKGQARARTWRSPNLLAIGLPGARDQVPDNCRDIVANKDPASARVRPVAVVNANDVHAPDALVDPSSTTWIKMSSVSTEGLRQAFLDWESRIRLNSDPAPKPHTELVAVFWAGGLLDGQALRFNEALNVFVGGRGAGKSTLIESLRYAFDLRPKGDEAKRIHESMVKSLLGQGATISVLVRSPMPSPRYYLIERIYGSRPRVRDENGELVDVAPQDILGTLEVYGQHEISELTRFPAKLADLLRRFTEPDTDASEAKEKLQEQLERSRTAIAAELTEINRIEDQLAALPGLREQLKRFAAAGLDAKLQEKTAIDKEASLFEGATKFLGELEGLGQDVSSQAEDAEPLLADDDSSLPNAALLAKLNDIQTKLLKKIEASGRAIDAAVTEAAAAVEAVKKQWTPKQTVAEQNYQKALKELKADGHDGSKYVTIKGQVERLKPRETELKNRKKTLAQLQKDRRELLAQWDAAKAQDMRELQKAARRVSKRLKDRVRVTVRPSSSLEPLEEVIRGHCSGNISQAVERLRGKADLNLTDLAASIAEGTPSLIKNFGFSQGAAERIAQGGVALALEVEECEIPAEAVLELNVGSEVAPNWKELDQLSTGQKATAVLLLLLLESDAPLIVDQPEDDLDNRFIADSIVPAMREEKCKRQFLFSTHNANIPVLGDAEQIIGLVPVVEAGVERTTVPPELCGSIDTPSVKELVKDLLEGGQAAFELRKQKYGF